MRSSKSEIHSNLYGGDTSHAIEEAQYDDHISDIQPTECKLWPVRESTLLPCRHSDTWFLFRIPLMSALSITLLVLYLSLGMVIFHTVEQNGEVQVTEENDFLLFDFIQEWFEKTYNQEYSNMTQFLSKALTELRDNGTELDTFWQAKSLGKQTMWTWQNALFYSFTVVTTIGYGNIVPTTELGRFITIIYGIFGVPIFLQAVSSWGEIVHQILLKVEREMLLRYSTFKLFSMSVRKILIILTFLIVFYAIFVMLAGLLISHVHPDGISFVTSCYFCYVTVSSIGFGDFTLLTYGTSLTVWIYYAAFMTYVFFSTVSLAGVVMFRVYSCNDNYVILTECS